MSGNDPNSKLTPREAAVRIGLSHKQLAKLRTTGDGPAFLKLGRKVMYEAGAIDRWLDTKRMTKAPPAPPRDYRQRPFNEQYA